MLVDSHCHLDFPDFSGDLDALVARANHRTKVAGDDELRKDRLDSGVQGLAGPVAWEVRDFERGAFEEMNTQAARGARDRSGATRRAAANDRYVGIDPSVH